MPYNEKILIVDDEPRMCDSLKELLSTQGYEIQTCCNGRDALACLAEESVDLILLDIVMEQTSGFEVMEKMARQHLDIPVILMTGNASTASAVEALRKGAFDYLRKPFEAEELFTSAKNALNQKGLTTDNHRVGKKLRESEERFRRFTENAKDVLYRMSLPDGHYEYVSPASIDLFGYSPEEFYESPLLIQKVIHPDWGNYLKEQWAALVSGNMLPFYEYQILHKSGEERWLHQRNALIRDGNGQPVAIEGIISDISAQKQAEEERLRLEKRLQQAQKAESLSQMAGAIAHQFNNQLMVIMGNLELVIEYSPPSDALLKPLTQAMTAARKAAEVSGLMLTYLGQTTTKKEPVDICEVCRLSLPLLQAVLPKRILLVTNFSSPGPTINGAVNQIQQILANLVTNAQEAVGDGLGAIELNVKTVLATQIPAACCFPVGWQPQEKEYACMEVVDAGRGIPEKDIEKIFDPFFTSKFTGRGLGLPVVLGIVRTHHGAIAVESELGKGSIFRVFFPLSGEAVTHPPEKQSTTPGIEGGGSALLVEDEDQVRKMAAIMLTQLGFTVIEAKSGEEAVAVFRRHVHQIRWVLCDLTMPGMNGWETLTALRTLSPDIPVVLASGYDERQVMAGDHPHRPDAFLQKPFSIKELSAAVGQALAEK